MKNILYKQHNENFIWLLMFLIVLQNIFPLQSHTKTVMTDTGRMVLICTLEGMVPLSLDENNHITEQQHLEGSLSSVAILFSELMSSAITIDKLAPWFSIFLPKLIIPPFFTIDLFTFNKSFQLIRAPPLP